MIRKIPLAASALLFPGAGWACSVCFSGARAGASLTAYYTITALMTGTALLLSGGFYFLVVRRYHAAAREEKALRTQPGRVPAEAERAIRGRAEPSRPRHASART